MTVKEHRIAGIVACIMFGASSWAFAASIPKVGSPVDMVPFGRVVTWAGPAVKFTGAELQLPRVLAQQRGMWIAQADPGEKSVNFGVAWDDPRAVRTIIVTYADQASAPSSVEDQELQVFVNPERTPIEGAETALQGQWRPFDKSEGASVTSSGLTWTYHLPNVRGNLYQVRIVLNGVKTVRIAGLEVEGTAKWRDTEFEVHFDPARGDVRNVVEGWNAEVLGIKPLASGDGLSVRALASDAPSDSVDRAIFTVRAGDRSFSFLQNDLDADGQVRVEVFGATVTKPGAAVAKSDGKAFIQRILEMPEQTYDGALNGIPPKNRTKWLSLSPPLNPNKWAVWPNGDFISREERDATFQSATGDVPDYNRVEPQHVESDHYPIVYSDWEDGGLKWEQGYVVTAPSGKFDDPTSNTLMITKISATNSGSTPATAKLWLRVRGGLGTARHVWLENNVLYESEGDQGRRVRGMLTYDGWNAEVRDNQLLFTANVLSGQTRSVELETTYQRTDSNYDRTSFDAARQETMSYWDAKLAHGADFCVPDERINNLWKSLLIHQYCWGDYASDIDMALPWVAAWQYGPVGSESSQMAKALDFYGHPKMAEDYFVGMWRIQGTDSVPALCTNGRGCLPGWWGGYVFNTGYQLWNLCNHYRLTGNRKWLDMVVPHLILACDWLAEQRRTTPTLDASGQRTIESGFFPPCGLEDEGGWKYWLMTNGYFYLGMSTTAQVLADIGHPDAKRIAEEAAEYLEDIHRGVAESTIRCPVVKLRDNTYVPYIPRHLYSRKRDLGEFETELGGLQLLTCNVYAADSRQMDWTLAFAEDDIFMGEALDHHSIIPLKDIETNWFNLGGFPKRQPFLVHTPIAYLRRDQPKLFLRSFWNALVAMNYPDINAFPEGINDYGAADCKTHEEAMWLQWFRWMLIFDEDNELRLCWTTPREWLEQGKSISVKNAPTFFGPISYRVTSDVDSGRITARVEFVPSKAPSNITIRFRHPKEMWMKGVTVNGELWSRFNAETETIDLPVNGQTVEVVADY